MERILISWIGETDLRTPERPASASPGPLLATLQHEQPQRAYLLYNYPHTRVKPYLDWLHTRTATELQTQYAPLESPVDYAGIHLQAVALLERVWQAHPRAERLLLLSPGTPAMQTIWVLLGKTRFPAVFVQSSAQKGVERIELPFEISAEFQTGTVRERLNEWLTAEVPATAGFERIITRHPRLQILKHRAAVLSRLDVPVLILGETGTGKELFARAIHNASARAGKPFVALNCGAIPDELIDSTLFGHVRGAFTGALHDQDGAFVEADGGTLFLDEFGELGAPAQVRLLRVLQEHCVVPVGGGRKKPRSVNVRLIAATHRDLPRDIADGRFREDLYYRSAIGVLELPPLRERSGDLHLLIEHFLADIRTTLGLEQPPQPGPGALNRLLRHSWPGNVRELHAVLLRAALWSRDGRLEDADIEAALLKRPSAGADLLQQPLSDGFNLDQLLADIDRHYLERALREAGGNHAQAARLLGFNNRQTFCNRRRRQGMNDDDAGIEK